MKHLITKDTSVTNEILNLIAHLPTKSLTEIIDDEFFLCLANKDFMRIAVLLAKKSYNEGGAPIGAVIIDNKTKKIVGKGHNTLVQENHPYNHGETSAIRDAGRIDFSKTTLFTSLSPCDICATLVYMRGFDKIIIGNITSANGTEEIMLNNGTKVEILEDKLGIDIYQEYRTKNPDLDLEDWKGISAIKK
ncbi:nucleoside deaminase [Rickettsiales bacterium LUAb2]